MLYDDTDEEEEEEEDDSIWDDCKDPDYVQTPLMMRRRAVSTHYRPPHDKTTRRKYSLQTPS